MPEGPEIRLAAEKVAAAVEGKAVQRVMFSQHRLRRFGPKLSGSVVSKIETKGKALLTHFDNGISIYSHNQLYGVWRIVAAGSLPKTKRRLRLALHADDRSALLYSASDISVWQTQDLDKHPFLAKLGPDILDPTVSYRCVATRLLDKPFLNRPLHSILMDQSFMAGVGNYLRSEILFQARLSPKLKPKQLNTTAVESLANAILDISRRSYESKGVTLPSRMRNEIQNQQSGRARNRFYVFGREGKSCYLCNSKIGRQEMGGRRLYWCVNCQGGQSGG
ncbi:MAG: endonuclease VIII [Cellvibrionales bacterium TMED148]|nr:endonuclease VIII [Porticoccaceae bacterium]RPG90455.1 MAG: endonuclease VIII [Cellvibrionales bacterium TMED148]